MRQSIRRCCAGCAGFERLDDGLELGGVASVGIERRELFTSGRGHRLRRTRLLRHLQRLLVPAVDVHVEETGTPSETEEATTSEAQAGQKPKGSVKAKLQFSATITSTLSASYHWRAIEEPTSGLFWWSAETISTFMRFAPTFTPPAS
mgnify:CR=1 FL=1